MIMEITQEITQLQQLVRQGKRVLPRGGGSKPALSSPISDYLSVSLASITGITAYSPEEYTITALAGTPLKEVQQALQQHQQYLPFDPPLAAFGATLGGAVASGLNGPGRYRYGGMRDFLLAIQMIDGLGRLVKGGGKVVKNAAGFDLPKLMIGSLGRLGILLELTFKVFPVPEAYATLKKEFVDLSEALELYWKFHNLQLDIDSLDLDLSNDKITLWVRIGGLKEAIQQRQGKLAHFVDSGETFHAGEDTQIWENKRNFTWVPPGWLLVKVTLNSIPYP